MAAITSPNLRAFMYMNDERAETPEQRVTYPTSNWTTQPKGGWIRTCETTEKEAKQ